MVPGSAWLGPIATTGVVSAVAFGCFRAYARRVDEDREGYGLRRMLVAGLFFTGIVAFVGVLGSGVDAASAATLAALGVENQAVVVAVNVSVAGLGVLVATTAGYLGWLPAVVRVRGIDVSPFAAARRFVRWTGVVVAMLVATVLLVGRLDPRSDWALAGIVGVLMAGVYLAGPWLTRVTTPTRSPTPDERERLAECCAAIDFEPRRTSVVDTGANRWPGILIRGPPGRRTLFATDRLLDAYDDDAVAALLAANVARARRHYTEFRLVVGAFAVLAGYWGLTSASDPVVALGAVAIVTTVALWSGNRLVYASDEAAVESAGREAVIGAYRAVAEDAGIESGGRFGAFLRMRPPLARRIERLEGDRTT